MILENSKAKVLAEKKATWVNDRVLFIKGLKKPTPQQKRLVELAEVLEKTESEERKFEMLVKSERAAERAAALGQAAETFLKNEAEATRAARNHRLILQGLLLDFAGLEKMDHGLLLGSLLSFKKTLQSLEPSAQDALKQKGDALLAEKEVARVEKKTRQSAKAAKPTKAPREPAATEPLAQQPAKNVPEAPLKRIAETDTRLHTAFEDKDTVKRLGARFNAEGKFWYAPAGSDLALFVAWL